MATNIQVQCINKTPRQDPHDRIKSVGGVNSDGSRWKLMQEDAIAHIEVGKYKFYVHAGGKSTWVVIATNNGRKYLKTENDGLHPNNLLSLPECP